jgi:hypothetical protein
MQPNLLLADSRTSMKNAAQFAAADVPTFLLASKNATAFCHRAKAPHFSQAKNAGDGIFGQQRDEMSLPRFFVSFFFRGFSFLLRKKKLEPTQPLGHRSSEASFPEAFASPIDNWLPQSCAFDLTLPPPHNHDSLTSFSISSSLVSSSSSVFPSICFGVNWPKDSMWNTNSPFLSSL